MLGGFRTRPLLIVFSILVFFLLFFLIQPHTCNAVVVWTEDFSDGNLDDWTISMGNFSATDNTLRATDLGWNFAIHDSNVAYGTWSFDVHVTETPDDHFYVYIISYLGSNYRFSIFTDVFPGWTDGDEYTLLRETGTTTIPIAEYIPAGDITGWVHFDVHRNATGYFSVYINNVLRMEVQDNDITQSSTFQFGTQIGPGIDNILVSNLESATEPPPGIPGFPWSAILIAIPVALGLAMFRRRLNP